MTAATRVRDRALDRFVHDLGVVGRSLGTTGEVSVRRAHGEETCELTVPGLGAHHTHVSLRAGTLRISHGSPWPGSWCSSDGVEEHVIALPEGVAQRVSEVCVDGDVLRVRLLARSRTTGLAP